MILTIVVFILVLSVLVFVHELGHFYSCRKLGVKAEEFGFGMPPRIGGIYRNKEKKWKYVFGGKKVGDAKGTVYSLNWIPLGGFVKIKGDDGEVTNETDNFINKPIWKRFVILSAGVFMNIVLAVVLFSIGYMFGLPQGIEREDPRAIITERKIQIVKVFPETPAEKAGLKMADVILSINGEEFLRDTDLQSFIKDKAGQELTYKIKRGDMVSDYKIRLETDKAGKAGAGIAIVNTGLVKYPWHFAIWEGLKTSIILTWVIILAFIEIIKNLIIGVPTGIDVAGPVGIASMTGQFARMGFVYLLQFTALLSVNLAVINFLPLPALDGGRVIFLIIEKIKGKPVKRELEAIIHNIGFIVLLALVLIITFRDVAQFADRFKMIFDKIF